MKNSAIIVGLIVCLSFKIHTCNAQLIDNRIDISVAYQTGIFHGKKLVQDNDFSYPSFYNNLNNINGVSAKILYKGRQNISYGIGLTRSNTSDWEYGNYQEYLQSNIEMTSFAAIVQFHNKFKELGIFNRYKFFVEISPTIGVSNFTTPTQLFIIHGSNNSITTPNKSNDTFYGINASAGVEWALFQSIGFLISYSFQHNWVTSMLYTDTHFTASQLNVAIVFKLMKNKRFLYKN